MKFTLIKHYFSAARINRYMVAVERSTPKAVRLYKANLKVAQSFHPLLNVVEVVLRNRINEVLSAAFADPDWIINQKSGFMSDPSLTTVDKRTGKTKVNDFLKREVRKAEQRLHKNNIPITTGKIIAEQTLGFWTDLFEVHHYRLLKGKPIQIFNTLPSGQNRKSVSDALHKIRKFRNRINHNEPICFQGNIVDFSGAEATYHAIMNILNWIDPELTKFTSSLNKVEKSINSAKRIIAV